MENPINKIIERDRALGDICSEAVRSYENKNYLAALACLFIAAEQALKFRMDVVDGNFHGLLEKAKEQNIVSQDEYFLISELKNTRNKLFHESHYPYVIEIDGTAYPAYEEEARIILYDKFALPVFEFVKLSVSD